MMTRSLAMSLVVMGLAGTASADAVDDYVQRAMKEAKVPGVSVLVRRDGKVIKSRGYGFANLEHQVAATADTIYQSGSVGKQFTAAGILLLIEEGKLSLDDRLVRFFPDGPASWHRISIRHLLTHTSGIKDYGEEFNLRQDYTEDEYLATAKKIPLEFEPGTQYSYSNTGYLVLGILISKLTGKHWSEFLAARLFEPLGMATTRVIAERDIVLHRAAGYVLDADGAVKNQDWVSPTANTTGDGALYFSIQDLAAWDAALDARQFMSAKHFEAWWTPVALANGTTYPYGFAWGIQEQRGYPLIEHGGSWQGFRAAIHRYPQQRLSVAVLSNLDAAEPEAMARMIAGLVEPALRLPIDANKMPDPDGERAKRLRNVLTAFAEYRVDAAMAVGLAATATGSAREAGARLAIGKQLAAAQSFEFNGEDDLSTRPVPLFGDQVVRIAYYTLRTKDNRFFYRFRLNAQGQVVDFDSEAR